MSLADLLYTLIPNTWFRKLSKLYYKTLKKMTRKITEEQFVQLLTERLDVQKGDTVFVHSAMSKLNIAFSPQRLLEILLEQVGEEGTLLFPCWHYIGRAETYLRNPDSVFDVRNSVTTLGYLNRLAMEYPGAQRSMHPTVSVCAIGKRAEELVATHHLDLYPCGEQSPWYKMLSHPAKVIGLGEKLVSLSFVHCVEDVMKDEFPIQTLSDTPIEGKVVDYQGDIIMVSTLYPLPDIQQRNVVRFFYDNISKKGGGQFKFKGSNYFRVDARHLFDEMVILARKGITIYGKF
ncbi:MAG TPA: AAC(3) family N-acetyltransferase [Bacteroidales bacterium]|jgi:aminoglycoside 3-N-acetyltransferase|nr:AAC(3) family N-acetyltransferase [Bacteroidales bacterium]